jgi:hypothetical protein
MSRTELEQIVAKSERSVRSETASALKQINDQDNNGNHEQEMD